MPDMDTAKAMEILGLDGNPSPADIKKAYREQVKIWHPDRYSEGSTLRRLAERNTQEANLAYAFLRRQIPAAPGKKQTAAPKTEMPTNSTPSPPPSSAAPTEMGRRLLAALLLLVPDKVLGRLLFGLRNASRNHFRPWYRYPVSSDLHTNQRHRVNFDQFLQKAMQNRDALKRIHRARRRSLTTTGEDEVMPVTNAAAPHQVNHHQTPDGK